MTNSEVKHKLNRYLNFNRLSAKERKEVERLLAKLESTNDPGLALYKSKYLIFDKKYDEARPLLIEALKAGNEDFSVYYLLYRVAVESEEFDKAYDYVTMCEETKTDAGFDFSLALAVAKATRDFELDPMSFGEETEQCLDTDNLAYSSNRAVNKLYVSAVEDFNAGNYIAARNKVAKITKVIEGPNNVIPFNFNILLDNLNSLVVRQKDFYLQSVRDLDSPKKVNSEEFDSVTCQKLLNYINLEVSRDVELAEEILLANEAALVKNVDSVLVYHVRKRIAERKLSKGMDPIRFEKYMKYLGSIRVLLRRRDYDKALEVAKEAKEKTGALEIDYYMGKILFKKGKFEEAEKVLSGYLGAGAYKALKAMHYLATIYASDGRFMEAKEVRNRIDMLNDYFIDDDIFKKPKGKPVDAKKNVTTANACHDMRTEIDKAYEGRKKLDPKNFDSYPFSKQMALIRELYRQGNTGLADRLTKKVSSQVTDPLQRKVINKEKANKALYKAKSKYGQG